MTNKVKDNKWDVENCSIDRNEINIFMQRETQEMIDRNTGGNMWGWNHAGKFSTNFYKNVQSLLSELGAELSLPLFN